MKNTNLIIIIAVAVLIALGLLLYGGSTGEEVQNETSTEAEETSMPTNTKNPIVVLKTNHGDIAIELFTDQMPITAGNFLTLARDGFYNEVKFHRVIDGFMIQGGDPLSKGDDTARYGTGGPGYAIEDEFVDGLSNVRGTISMANAGPNSGGSQFFINLVDNVALDFDKEPLSSKHPVFGKVVEGMDVVGAIAKTETGIRDIPVNPVVIESVEIQE